MPRHDSLLAAQVAFLLYGGRVIATHPSGTENALPALLDEAVREGAIDQGAADAVGAYLRGEGDPPPGLGLVGRYSMGPHGPLLQSRA